MARFLFPCLLHTCGRGSVVEEFWIEGASRIDCICSVDGYLNNRENGGNSVDALQRLSGPCSPKVGHRWPILQENLKRGWLCKHHPARKKSTEPGGKLKTKHSYQMQSLFGRVTVYRQPLVLQLMNTMDSSEGFWICAVSCGWRKRLILSRSAYGDVEDPWVQRSNRQAL